MFHVAQSFIKDEIAYQIRMNAMIFPFAELLTLFLQKFSRFGSSAKCVYCDLVNLAW